MSDFPYNQTLHKSGFVVLPKVIKFTIESDKNHNVEYGGKRGYTIFNDIARPRGLVVTASQRKLRGESKTVLDSPLFIFTNWRKTMTTAIKTKPAGLSPADPKKNDDNRSHHHSTPKVLTIQDLTLELQRIEAQYIATGDGVHLADWMDVYAAKVMMEHAALIGKGESS